MSSNSGMKRAACSLGKRALVDGVPTRLNLKIRDEGTARKLQHQAGAARLSKTALVNELLELLFSKPAIFRDGALENLLAMHQFFGGLPLEQIQNLAARSHRSPEQMLIHLVMKGLTAYEASHGADLDR